MGIFDGIMIYSDWDGTLYVNGEVPSENRAAIKYFQSNGGKFGICTGRYHAFTEQFYEFVTPNTYHINLNGAYIFNPDTQSVIYEGFTDERLFDVIDKALATDAVFSNVQFCTNENDMRITLTPCEYRAQKAELMQKKLYKALFWSENDELGDKNAEILSKIEFDGYIAARSWRTGIELLRYENTKGIAVRRAKALSGSRILICVGDYENDIEMLKAADISYAVGNALDSVKKHATYITVPAEDSAIAKIIFETEQRLVRGEI